MAYVRRSLLWLAGAALVTPLTWGTAASACRFLLTPVPEDTPGFFLASVLVASIWGAAFTAMFVVPYGAVLLAWPELVREWPALERTRAGLTIASAGLALPAALVVGLESGHFAGAIRAREFTEAFLSTFVGGWLGLLLPRLLIKWLSPGCFISSLEDVRS